MLSKFKSIYDSKKYSFDPSDEKATYSDEEENEVVSIGVSLDEMRGTKGWAILKGFYNDLERESYEDAKDNNFDLLKQVKGIDLLLEKIDNVVAKKNEILKQDFENKKETSQSS